MQNKQITKTPAHIAIIMDGNGRWAQARGKNRSYGHRAGSDNVDRVVTHAFNNGVKAITLYAFSCENWSRPKEEVDALMKLIDTYFAKFLKKTAKKNVRLCVIGDRSVLSDKIKKTISDTEEKTKDKDGFILNIALNYGGRQEIVNAVNTILKSGEEVSVENISKNLYTAISGEPDLIIRTGGELRLSNFLLFQGAYSELYFTDVLWPDFDEKELDKALEEFAKRNRRFGGVNNA